MPRMVHHSRVRETFPRSTTCVKTKIGPSGYRRMRKTFSSESLKLRTPLPPATAYATLQSCHCDNDLSGTHSSQMSNFLCRHASSNCLLQAVHVYRAFWAQQCMEPIQMISFHSTTWSLAKVQLGMNMSCLSAKTTLATPGLSHLQIQFGNFCTSYCGLVRSL